MWKWTSRILRSLIGVAALLIGIALFMYLASTREAPRQRTVASALPVVRAVEVASRPVARRWTGYGTARAMTASDVAAQVAGRVVERPEALEAGVRVEAGDLLLRIDPTDFEQRARAAGRQVEAIEADLSGLEIEEARLAEQAELLEQELEVARRDLERARTAFAQGAGNESQVDARLQLVQAATRSLAAISSQLERIPSRRASLNASLDSARADLALAEENLARTAIRAPFAGVLQSLDLEVGEWARVGDVAGRVVDLSRIEVPLRVPQDAGAALSVGDPATLRTEGTLTRAWPAEVSRIAPEADPATRSLTVFVEVRQPSGAPDLLRPGQFVMGEVSSGDVRATLIVPRHTVNGDRLLVVRPLGETDPDPPAGAVTPMVVREAIVDVTHHLQREFPEVAPNETQWAVLSASPVAPGRSVDAGDLIPVSNLDSLRPGDLVDVRIIGQTAQVRRDADESTTGARP